MEGDSELQDLYREVLLDYFRSGAHKGALESATLRSRGINPVCGDEIELALSVGDGRITAIRYSGHGCVISQASAAIMAEALEGKTLPEVKRLATAFKSMMTSASAEALPAELEAASALEGVRRFPIRVKCATLGWNTLIQGLSQGKVSA